ncbi:unnamed protein product [Sphagnum troendelagicum]
MTTLSAANGSAFVLKKACGAQYKLMPTRVLLLQSFAGEGRGSVGGRPPKSYAEREESVSESGQEGRKAQEKDQQVQRRWRSNLMAKERVGPATKGAP